VVEDPEAHVWNVTRSAPGTLPLDISSEDAQSLPPMDGVGSGPWLRTVHL
jgi:hypothetical protein